MKELSMPWYFNFGELYFRHSAHAFCRGAGLFDNRIILWGIVLEIALILGIDYTTWGNMIFGTPPIAPEAWLFIMPFALGMLLLEELRKFVVVRLRR